MLGPDGSLKGSRNGFVAVIDACESIARVTRAWSNGDAAAEIDRADDRLIMINAPTIDIKLIEMIWRGVNIERILSHLDRQVMNRSGQCRYQLDLKELGPKFAGDEQPIVNSIISNTIQHAIL